MSFKRAKRALRGARAHTWLSALVALAMVLACAGPIYADTWQAGDLVTYEQSDWGDFGGSAGQLLFNTYFNVFASTGQILEVGIQHPPDFSITFDNVTSVLAFLPAVGPPGPLDAAYIDPSSTPAGDFGGDVVALALNVAYSDAGLLGGTSTTLFGDLVLTNLTSLPLLNGMTVRDFLAMDNELLGGGSGVYSIDAVSGLTSSLNGAFRNGAPSVFAQQDLTAPSSLPSSVPEPSSAVLLGSGLAALAAARKRKGSSRPLRFRTERHQQLENT